MLGVWEWLRRNEVDHDMKTYCKRLQLHQKLPAKQLAFESAKNWARNRSASEKVTGPRFLNNA
jgi:hypothetical protein